MNINLQKLEFNKILDILQSYCLTNMGKDMAYSLLPKNTKQEVAQLLAETDEAINLIYRNSTPAFSNIEPIDITLKNLENGATLSCKSILNLCLIFKLSHNLKEYFNKDFLNTEDYPILSNLFNNLYSNKSIIDVVNASILDEHTISDSASSVLSDIRRKQRKLEQDIRSKLNSMLHSKYVQESIITVRNDRFVIPVKEEYRSSVKGFVHDISNAGSTVFIEPIAVFEMNNELNKLKMEEELEIERVLQKLSSLFIPYSEQLSLDIEIIGNLDYIFAKAKYAKNINGIIPKINENKELNFINAKHPLIDTNKVVPISVNLGHDFSTLLITGPNTGGKTVTLKTIGLLSCMACSGLAIPCENGSSIYVFDNIFADIGDDQSISDSLSTFSSHIVNIVEIIKKATSNSLILVDELGSGTDPIEGANLAISILDYFKQKTCLTIATTHYQELKQYALVTEGFENASVEFDVKTMTPTYRLLVGIPGKSNAFEISKNLGLDMSIIENAKSMMSSEQTSFEELLKNIYDNKSKIEKEKEEIELKLKNVDTLEKSLIFDKNALKEKEQEIIVKAKNKARDILLEAKEDANEIIKELNNIHNSSKDANDLRNKLNIKIKNVSNSENSELDTKVSSPSLNPKEINKNMEVFVKSLGKNGTVISNISKSNEVQVQVGFMKLNVSISDLEKVHSDKAAKIETSKNTSGYTSISKSRTAKSEINVIGLTVEDAIFVVDKFLDDSALAKLKTVRIVHGKGTRKITRWNP